jgi:beta-lactamase superfamily II metal-dependent hydrolase
MTTVAQEVLWPTDTDIRVRVAFLHVGQGSSALIFVSDQDTYKTLLIDINLHEGVGIDVPRLMSDLLGEQGLDVFVNTHPHNDHLNGLSDLSELVEIREVWHSGHIPGEKHCDKYAELEHLIESVDQEDGNVIELQGSREPQRIGDAEYYVLSPAEYVKDEISGETADARYERIHEHSVVLKFGKDATWIMIPGDADRDAWEKHITNYHHERLGANVLAAPHHGSRTFFQEDEKDEPYLDALKAIDPEYIVVSAPTQKESQYDHPHESAMQLYAAHVGEDKVLHTGANRFCFICDICQDGCLSISDDEGKLIAEYLYGEGDEAKAFIKSAKPRQNDAPEWEMRCSENKVHIVAAIHSAKDGKKMRDISSDGRVLRDGRHLLFTAKSEILEECDVYWKVVNTGQHAEQENDCRGTIFLGEAEQWEHTSYTGKHWIECFLVQNGVCIAHSGRFYVNVKNRRWGK